jgi:type II secretory pathway predicted ATPase ExeA
MARWFNIAGPCFPDEHYMIPPERRMGELAELIEQGRWCCLVSGRQTGKTTVLHAVEKMLRAQGRLECLWVDLQAAREDAEPRTAVPTVLDVFDRVVARELPDVARPSREQIASWCETPATALSRYLGALCGALTKPLVLLFDEADCLRGRTLVTFLTQLRELYLARHKSPAPYSVVLVGVRAVRDYALDAKDSASMAWLGTASPFNVTVENVNLAPFTSPEVRELVEQHTRDTGQRFEDEAVTKIAELTAGHPWLVNALADQVTRRDVCDRAVAITAEHIERAKETIILERRTHIDSLLARLREDRVRRVLDPMLSGGVTGADVLDDDFAYVAGLGLIRLDQGRWVISNPIYREVIPRALTAMRQLQLPFETAWYVRADGSLDLAKLMGAWQEFWREDGHLALDGFGYQESGPHLMLMAFLQRIVNGGGRIEREYALGRGALDLVIAWKTWRYAIEVKVRHTSTTEARGVKQLGAYLASMGLGEGWLVIFDMRMSVSWDERIHTHDVEHEGRTIHVLGC